MASIKLKGDTSGEVTISAPSVAGTTTLELPATSSTLATQNSLGVRNLIINGAMQVAQRGTSFTGVGGSSVTYTVDRWAVREATDAVVDVSQATDSPSTDLFKYCLKLDVTTADASIAAGQVCTVQHRIEAQDLVRAGFGTANAKQLTISFWHKHTKTGTYSVGFTNHNGTRGYPAEYTQSVSDTWEKSTVTFTADTTGTWATDNTLGMIVYFSVAAGTDFHATVGAWTGANDFASSSQVNALDSTSNSFRLTGVQLEVGDTATPFEHRPYDMELQRCMRYYQQFPASSQWACQVQQNYPTTQYKLLSTVVLPVPIKNFQATVTIPSGVSNRGWVEGGNVRTSIGQINGNNGQLQIFTDYSGTDLSAYSINIGGLISIDAEL